MNDEERFPYRLPAGASRETRERVRQKTDETLHDVINLLWQQVRKRAKGRLSENEIEEVVAAVLVAMWAHSLPKFDAKRHTKPSTFIATCAGNAAADNMRSFYRKPKRKRPMNFSDVGTDGNFTPPSPARDTSCDRKVEAAADAIRARPEAFGLTPRQSQVLRAVTDAPPGKSHKDLARELGYGKQSELSVILNRIRQIIARVDLDQFGNGESERSAA